MKYVKLGFKEVFNRNVKLQSSMFNIVPQRGEVEIAGQVVPIYHYQLLCEAMNGVQGLTGYVVKVCDKYNIFLSEPFDPNSRHHMAIVAHEAGHIVRRHLEGKGFLYVIRRILNDTKNEMEADLYSANEGHSEALCELLEGLDAVRPSRGLKRRIKALKINGV